MFYGSASVIKAAGPAVLLAYLIGCAAVFIVMRALGEDGGAQPGFRLLRQLCPPASSGRWPGLLPAGPTLFEMVIVASADVTAFGIYMGVVAISMRRAGSGSPASSSLSAR
ncbi:hypothetical protein MJK72_09535 [Klebsiella pneumoniae]|nr:hypothetical protein MJK72_09535 [Klebsiella pneumoniae]